MKGMHFVKQSATMLATLGLAGFLSQSAAAMETLKIGTDLTYPPYNYLEGKEAAGFDAEFMRLVANRITSYNVCYTKLLRNAMRCCSPRLRM